MIDATTRSSTSGRLRIYRYPLEISLCILLISLVVVVVVQVVARYVIEAPVSWSEETARFLLMWLSMLGAAYAYRSGAHFSLRVVVVRLPIQLQKIVLVAGMFILVGFFGALLAASIVFVVSAAGQVAPGLRIPMTIPYSSTVVGSALMLYDSCIFAWREIATRGLSSNETRGAE